MRVRALMYAGRPDPEVVVDPEQVRRCLDELGSRVGARTGRARPPSRTGYRGLLFEDVPGWRVPSFIALGDDLFERVDGTWHRSLSPGIERALRDIVLDSLLGVVARHERPRTRRRILGLSDRD